MKVVLPGKPASRLQALSTGYWDSRRIIAYITGNALAILSDYDTLLQTIYDDEETSLEAVAVDEISGQIAVCTARIVRSYKPYQYEEGALKWALRSTFEIGNQDAPEASGTAYTAPTLSWGSEGELLVGRSTLQLYHITNGPTCIWQQDLPSPVKSAALSFDSGYIACFGYSDRLVKLWRRLNYTDGEVCFDLQYLPHSQAIVSAVWRRPRHVEQSVENVLYTFCQDGTARIWTGSDVHGGSHLHLWGRVDLSQPQGIFNASWVTVLQGRDFSAAAESAVKDVSANQGKPDAAIDYAVQVANQGPEMILALDVRGKLRAWAMENISCKSQASSNIFLVADIASLSLEPFGGSGNMHSSHTILHAFCNPAGGELSFLCHSLDGQIRYVTSDVARLLDAQASGKRFTHKTTWSGHSTSIAKMVRNFSGHAVVSRTRSGEAVVWHHHARGQGGSLQPKAMISDDEHIRRICVLRKGRFVVVLHHKSLALWDCRDTVPTLLATQPFTPQGVPLCLIILPREDINATHFAHLATITSESRGYLWKITLPKYANAINGEINGHADAKIAELDDFTWTDTGDLAYVLPVDPAGSTPVASGFLDVFAKDVAVSFTSNGRLEFWTAKLENDKLSWKSTSSMESHISQPSLISGSTSKKVALVDSERSTLTIWNVGNATLEFQDDFDDKETIQDLDWTATPDAQSILAVGFRHRVLLLSQMRFDYLNKGPAWAAIREINIRELTSHPIGDSTWLGDGNLVIGAGNQLFVYDRLFEASDTLLSSAVLPGRQQGKWDLFEVVQQLNGTLAVFHPQFLSQCLLAGHITLVQQVLLSLSDVLKYHVEGEKIDQYLGMDLELFYKSHAQVSFRPSVSRIPSAFAAEDHTEDEEIFGEDVAEAIKEKLTKIKLPGLSPQEQIQVADMIECIGLVEKQRRSMDENGARYMLFYRQHALRKGRTQETAMSWREINWAYHSTSQDILTEFVTRQHHGKLLWDNARESGLFMWLTDLTAVRAQFEIVARNEYTKSESRDPTECSLFYLALRKKTVLQGLWRMAIGNKEQTVTQKFLGNNFGDPKWKTAASKNAYVLLSKRRFAYSAAFFLLADHLQDAVNVCLQQIKDVQLAIAIARVHEGDDGPILRKLLEEEVLPLAAREGNRWLASWAFWMLHRRDMSVRALITPVYNLVETPGPPALWSQLFLTDDPALIVLYEQLRQKTLQTLRGASKISPQTEWNFVLHNARLYSRMGCDLLGLNLARNWEFMQPTDSMKTELGGDVDPRKLMRRRSSLVVDDLPTTTKQMTHTSIIPEKKVQPPPVVFEEPDTSSLLDNFGF